MHVANLLLSFLCASSDIFLISDIFFTWEMFFHLKDGGSLVSHSLSFSVLPPPSSSWCLSPLSSQVVAPPFSWYFVILPVLPPPVLPAGPFLAEQFGRGGEAACAVQWWSNYCRQWSMSWMIIELSMAMVTVIFDCIPPWCWCNCHPSAPPAARG